MIHLIVGENRFAARELVHTLAGDSEIERLEADKLSPAQLSEQLQQGASLFASARSLIIEQLSVNRLAWEALNEQLALISEDLTLILIESKPDKRTRTYKSLQKQATLHDAKELDPSALTCWAAAWVRERGSELGQSEANLLVERVGPHQERLASELEKLTLHQKISEDLIVDLVEATPQSSAFDLLDAVLLRQPGRVADLIGSIRSNNDPYQLFGLLAISIYNLAVVVSAPKPLDQSRVAREAGIHPYVVGKLAGVANNMSSVEIGVLARELARLDRANKSSGVDPWDSLEVSLMKLATR